MRTAILTIVLISTVSGCESFRAPLVDYFADRDELRTADEDRRMAFLRDGDAEAVRWLLGHRVESGMDRSDVEAILGMPGERVHDAAWKNEGGTRFQVTDTVYKWGPDTDGKSYYLVFRENLLVNHDRREYRS